MDYDISMKHDKMMYKVGEIAEIAGISVRTLHHYDRIGLLKPESVSPVGYRLYSCHDLERLQQILFFKELGFNLQETGDIINKPDFDRIQALNAHKEILTEKMRRLQALIDSVEKTIHAAEGGGEMGKKEMFEAFDMSVIENHKKKYAEETMQKYGHTDAYKESEKKTSGYTKEDWARIFEESGRIYKTIADNMDKGPADPEVQKAVAAWRRHITDSFYNCTPEIFRGLADLYEDDERFTANIDKIRPGLARFLSDAMRIYCIDLEKLV